METYQHARTQILETIETSKQEMFELLKSMVNQDSFSKNKDDVNRLGALLIDWLKQHHYHVEIIPQQQYGNQIIATLKGHLPGKIVIMGHMDTVFPHGTASERPFSFDEKRFYGPGVADMKSGIVIALYASWITNLFSKEDMCDIELLLTSDEELASPCSHSLIQSRVKDALAVFNVEPARADGSVVTARRGSAQVAISVNGKPAHAGLAIEDGISAISEICQKFIDIEKMTDKQVDITVNLGTINGGTATNTVAPQASGTLHFGFWTNEIYHDMFSKAQEIVNHSYVAGTRAELMLLSKCYPMVKTPGTALLYEMVLNNARDLGITLTEQATRSAADSGIPSTMGTPTICGMGPIGGHLHSDEEYIEARSFYERTQLLALSLLSASDYFTKHQVEGSK